MQVTPRGFITFAEFNVWLARRHIFKLDAEERAPWQTYEEGKLDALSSAQAQSRARTKAAFAAAIKIESELEDEKERECRCVCISSVMSE